VPRYPRNFFRFFYLEMVSFWCIIGELVFRWLAFVISAAMIVTTVDGVVSVVGADRASTAIKVHVSTSCRPCTSFHHTRLNDSFRFYWHYFTMFILLDRRTMSTLGLLTCNLVDVFHVFCVSYLKKPAFRPTLQIFVRLIEMWSS